MCAIIIVVVTIVARIIIAHSFNFVKYCRYKRTPAKRRKCAKGLNMDTSNTKEIFSLRLLELRKKKRLSRQKVADDLNISRSTLEYYEKCKRVPDIETLNNIAHYYVVSTDYLLGNTDNLDPDIDFTKNIDFVYLYTGLDEDAFETLLNIRKDSFFEPRYINGAFSKIRSSQYQIVEALNHLLLSDNGLDLLALICEFIETHQNKEIDQNKKMSFLVEIIEKLKLCNNEFCNNESGD